MTVQICFTKNILQISQCFRKLSQSTAYKGRRCKFDVQTEDDGVQSVSPGNQTFLNVGRRAEDVESLQEHSDGAQIAVQTLQTIL